MEIGANYIFKTIFFCSKILIFEQVIGKKIKKNSLLTSTKTIFNPLFHSLKKKILLFFFNNFEKKFAPCGLSAYKIISWHPLMSKNFANFFFQIWGPFYTTMLNFINFGYLEKSFILFKQLEDMNTITEKVAPQSHNLRLVPLLHMSPRNEGPLLLGAITISLAPSQDFARYGI